MGRSARPRPDLGGARNRAHLDGTLVHVTDPSEAKQAIRTLACCLLPYRDPLARRQVRRAARALIAPGPWEADKANSNEVAQLALLRLLWLQREAHRAANAQMFEAVALLTRSTVDTCIVGLYCLAVPDAAERINQLNADNLTSMLKYLPTTFYDPGIRSSLVGLIDTPQKKPNTFDMVSAIDAAAGDDKAEMLYRAYYAPLSTLYAHGGGMALLRHVKNDKITDRPAKSWLKRSALHIVDSCLGLLAARLAHTRGAEPAAFNAYYEAHRGRTITPLFTMAGANAGTAINWPQVPASVLAGWRLRTYLSSGQAARDDDRVREKTIRELAERCFRGVHASSDPEVLRLSVEGVLRQALSQFPRV